MERSQLPGSLHPNAFPAKLWRLANSPGVSSVRWDACGEGLLIQQAQFEHELLGAAPAAPGDAGAGGVFKTKSFASFIRQLNLYGFHKLLGPAGSASGDGSAGLLHHFKSPYCRRDRPDLLVHLKRLTKGNRAKLAAGLHVPSRPPGRSHRPLGTSPPGHARPLPSALGTATGAGLSQGFYLGSCATHSTQASYPTAAQQSSSSRAHAHPLPDSAGSTFWISSNSSSLQNPPVLSVYPANLPSSNYPEKTSGEASVPEAQLQEMCSLLADCFKSLTQPERVTGELAKMEAAFRQCVSDDPPLVNSESSYPLASAEESLLQLPAPQIPPVLSPQTAELPLSDWRDSIFDEEKKTEGNLKAEFKMLHETCSLPEAEIGEVEPVAVLQKNSDQPLLVTGESSDTAAATEENPLQFLLAPLAFNIPLFMEANEHVVTLQEASEKPREQAVPCPVQPVRKCFQEESLDPEQNAPVLSPQTAELPPSEGLDNLFDEEKKTEGNLEPVIPMVEETYSESEAETVNAEAVEIQTAVLHIHSDEALLVNSESSDTAAATKESALQLFLASLDFDTPFFLAGHEQPVSIQEASENLSEQQDPCPTQAIKTCFWEEPFGPEQNPPVLSPRTAELPPSDGLDNIFDEEKKKEDNLEAEFGMVDGTYSASEAEIVKVEPVEIQTAVLHINSDRALRIKSEDGDTAAVSEGSALQLLLTPLAVDKPFFLAGHEESVSIQEAGEKLSGRQDPCPAQPVRKCFQEEPFGPEQDVTGVQREFILSESEEREVASREKPVKTSVKAQCRKRRSDSPWNVKSLGLRLREDAPRERMCSAKGQMKKARRM